MKSFNPSQPRDPTNGQWVGAHDVMNVVAGSTIAKRVRSAADAISAVHRLPKGSQKVVVKTDQALDPTEGGGYGHAPGRIPAITLNPARADLELSASHEFGHYVDQHLLGDGIHFASQDGKLPELMAAIDAGPGIQELHDIVRRTTGKRQEHAAYLARPREKFARAYAQYIAVRSAHPEMLKHLAAHRAGVMGENMFHQDEHFAPVAAAFDKLFASKGWRQP